MYICVRLNSYHMFAQSACKYLIIQRLAKGLIIWCKKINEPKRMLYTPSCTKLLLFITGSCSSSATGV